MESDLDQPARVLGRHALTSFILRRGGRALCVLLLVAVATMALPQILPGSAALAVLGTSATEQEVAAFTVRHHLDANPVERLGMWASAALQGDFGTSIVSGSAVAADVAERLPITLELVILSQLVALALALPVALRAAWRPGSLLDRVAGALAFVLLSIPGFVLGLLLIFVFAVSLRMLPATGWVPFSADPVGHIEHVIMPVLTMSLAEAAVYMRTLRSSAGEVLVENFIHAARSRGMASNRVLWTRVLRPAALPLITVVGINIGTSFGGALVVETLFAIPGMGRLLSTAIAARDYPVIETLSIMAALAVVVATALVDVSYRFVDPRIAHVSAR